MDTSSKALQHDDIQLVESETISDEALYPFSKPSKYHTQHIPGSQHCMRLCFIFLGADYNHHSCSSTNKDNYISIYLNKGATVEEYLVHISKQYWKRKNNVKSHEGC